MPKAKVTIPWPPARLTLPDAETLDALGDMVNHERRIQAERQEEIRKAGGVYDPVLRKWIEAKQ